MGEINKRLFQKMKENNIKPATLADYLGVNKSVIYTWRTRETDPGSEFILRICDFLNITIEWLITGKEKPDTNNLTENEKELLQHFQKLPDREQIKFIGRIEDAAAKYQEEGSSTSKIG